MKERSFKRPHPIVDAREKVMFLGLTEKYNEMLEPTKAEVAADVIAKGIAQLLRKSAEGNVGKSINGVFQRVKTVG